LASQYLFYCLELSKCVGTRESIWLITSSIRFD